MTRDQCEEFDYTIIIILFINSLQCTYSGQTAMSSGLVSLKCLLLFIVIDFVGSLS